MESKSAAFLHIFPMLTLMRPLFVASEKKLRFTSLFWVFMVLYAFEMKYFLKYRSECENLNLKVLFSILRFFCSVVSFTSLKSMVLFLSSHFLKNISESSIKLLWNDFFETSFHRKYFLVQPSRIFERELSLLIRAPSRE